MLISDFVEMSFNLIQSLDSHQDRVWCVSWNPKGNLLASCSSDRTIKIWGKEGGIWICKSSFADQHNRTVRFVSWSPCGNFLAAASFDATVSIWDRRNGEFECIATLEGHENEVKSVAWSCSGNYLATCSRDKSVWIWQTEEEEYECASVLSKHTQDVKAVVWHPNVDIVASCSYDDTINLYKEDDDDWVCFDSLAGHTSTVWSISFNKSGDRIVSSSDDKTLKIWQCYEPKNMEGIKVKQNSSCWKCICTLAGYHLRPIYSVDWNHQNDLIASCSADDSIKIFKQDDVECFDKRNEPIFNLVGNLEKAHLQDINCLKWNPKDSSILASCSDDMSIKIWNFSL
ncbi:probable cytosolic iron-sulfur protein assembly protein CIAO1 homolog [Hydra vulgaris]|uniref:Probable cytosolic iron-sulfur protein assembly protein CIAO1 homolog n=1 Tax=Hydra vulgaris TaxID=6087 RepID=A0ABM4CYX4_HYDVU